jgi:hypothetical protein
MPLTTPQLQLIKSWMATNAAGLSDGEAADLLNAVATPTYYVYRSSVPMSGIMTNGFDWTRVDNLSVGKARIWEWMIEADPQGRTINPVLANVRAGINAVWVGTAADLAVRAAVYLHCFRPATVAEKLLKIAGNGTVCDAAGDGPATVGYTSPIAPVDCETARNLP